MKRLTERLSAALARLAFWRTPAAPTDAADAAPDEAPAPEALPAETPVPADAPKLIEDAATQTDAPQADEALAAEPQAPAAAAETSTASASDAAEPEPIPPSLFTRLLARLRPRPAIEPTEDAPADLPPPSRDEADAAESEPPPARARRLIALLSKKVVWIPAASLALFALVGTLGALLWQSGQDRAALEAKLKAAEQQLEQTARPALPVTTQPVAPPADADAETTAAATRSAAARPLLAGGDCDINNAEGVSLRLKDCIDAFNQEAAAPARSARQASTPR